MRTIAASLSNKNTESCLHSSVLPTPVGPRNRKLPKGLLCACSPARDKRITLLVQNKSFDTSSYHLSRSTLLPLQLLSGRWHSFPAGFPSLIISRVRQSAGSVERTLYPRTWLILIFAYINRDASCARNYCCYVLVGNFSSKHRHLFWAWCEGRQFLLQGRYDCRKGGSKYAFCIKKNRIQWCVPSYVNSPARPKSPVRWQRWRSAFDVFSCSFKRCVSSKRDLTN